MIFFSSSVVLKINLLWPLILCRLGNFHVIVFVCRLFLKLTFFKLSFRKTFRVINGFNPNQDQRYISPYLDTNCLPRLSADDKVITS